MYRGGHDDKGTWTKESVQFLCTLIKRIDNLQELIDDANIATNKTNSSFKIQEDIKEAQRELKEYVESIVSQRLRTEIVPALPDLTIIKENVIYMTPILKLDENGNPTGGSDGYNQYMFINGKIEYLGGTKISLTDYYTKQECNMLHSELEDKIGKNNGLIGSITAYAGQTVPEGYMICDGSILNKADYPELFDIIGTAYGGDGVDTFRIPNLLGKVITCVDVNDTDLDTVGKTGGAKTVTLTTNEMPSHTHTFTGTAHNHPGTADSVRPMGNNRRALISPNGYNWTSEIGSTISGSSNTYPMIANWTGDLSGYSSTLAHGHALTINSTTAGGTNDTTGGDEAHENMPPYMALNYIIRVK